MIIKHREQRVAVFIDVSNMYHSAKNLYRARVNFQEVLRLAVSGRKLIRAFAYVISTKGGEETPFFEALEKFGIEKREKELQEFYGGIKKADWDVGLVVDAIRTAELVDTVVLVSGDGDFVPLIDYLKGKGRRAEVMAFGRTSSLKLKEAADEFTDFDQIIGKILLKIKKIGK